MKRKYRAQAFLAGSSCATCDRERCARDARKHLPVIIYCRNYLRARADAWVNVKREAEEGADR